ncbi:FAD-dependent oxidoreductase [Paracoccus fistulariae]|uniref:FAD-dependent oxidoreductase n=1 Tax=Paracoccus fistulariae TaxID=658446 RepID=A0ABY7SGU0_9RHOB|nr:FAD-dependent oxidoreductase [Paracoccus fistulariae]MDB6181686.1 FAD-dependent oxidoreductase [Paracoccus fistulariae]WCR06011.1 FAD-dependent oxidoreductase [Paracoccus fistulariae]
MPSEQPPHLLLLGAGHANLLATRPLRAALPEARITLIDAAPHATYSGMFPGMIAGYYRADQPQVDLRRFADDHRITFRQGRITGIDPVRQRVQLLDGEEIPYDLAALNLGSHSAMPEIAGFAEHAVPIKPLDGFADRLARTPARAPAAIIGGGVAGAEIALALRQSRPVTLIEAGPRIAASLGARARGYLTATLSRAGVSLLTNARVARIEHDAVILTDGARIASRLTIGLAGARPHEWLARDLPVDQAGFVRIGPTLQVEGHATLLAAGDSAAMTHAPRPKVGVYAVRQGPVLAQNLIALHRGQTLTRYDPQRDYLKIISLGDGRALAEWHGVTLHGRWLWRWKDRIDRRFLRSLRA